MIKHTAPDRRVPHNAEPLTRPQAPITRPIGTELAPEPLRWVCGACGKTSRSRYGFDEESHRVADDGYDESCISNAQLCEPTGNATGPRWRTVEPEQ